MLLQQPKKEPWSLLYYYTLIVCLFLCGRMCTAQNDPSTDLVVCYGTCAAPYSVALDPVIGDLWIADFGGNRVLNYGPPSSLTLGSAPIQVLGQVDFTSTSANNPSGVPTSSSLYLPTSLTFDQRGNLWVADYGNNRVLRYDKTSTKGNGALLIVF